MKHSRGVYRKRNSRLYQSKRGRSKAGSFYNYKKIIGLVVFSLFIVLIVYPIVSKKNIEYISSSAQAQKGSSEFSIGGADQWTFLQESVDLFAGDELKTLGNGNASLSLLGGNTIFMAENSEIKIEKLEKTDQEKIAAIELVKGDIWIHVGETGNEENKSTIKIATSRQTTTLSKGIFAFSADEAADDILAIKGEVISETQQLDGASLVSITTGEKISVTDDNKELISADNSEEFLTDVPREFIESEWHIKNLAKFFPSEALLIQERINKSNTVETTEEVSENSAIASPVITSPDQNISIPASTNSIKIEGTAPENTYQISVNGYALTKYQPGDQKWSYFASTNFGTMVPGKNIYSVVATTRDGQVSAPDTVEINYEGVAISAAEDLVAETASVPNFASPTITAPAGLSSNAPWETSSSIVTIKGSVPKETNKVTVNEFALRQFRIGSGEFSYIANAQYGNFVKGENLYVIKAFGPDGKSSETSVEIIYTPVNL